MNPTTATAEQAEVDDTEDQRTAAATAETAVTTAETNRAASTLRAMTTSAVMGSGMMAFLPANMSDAMDFAKLMAASTFVPPHLRGKAGDCLAIVLQSIRWGADPYAVASKSYFVNDRMAYEAQLVNAVVNTSKILDGRLQVTWQGAGPTLACTVRGRLKGDSDVHELIQEIGIIKTKNSPLWVSSPKVQLAYYTTRAWGRLFAPEVLLGIYTPDEIEESEPMPPGTQQVIPPRPTRESVKAEKEAIDRQQREAEDREAHVRTTAREETPHDSETGEVTATDEGGPDRTGPTNSGTPSEPAKEQDKPGYQTLYDELLAKVKQTGNPKSLNALLSKDETAADLDLLRTEAPELSAAIAKEIAGRRTWFAR